MPSISDALPEAEQVWQDIFRTMSPERKLRMVGEMWHEAKALHAAGVRTNNPQATAEEIQESWLKAVLEPADYQKIQDARLGKPT